MNNFPMALQTPADGYFNVEPQIAGYWLANCRYRNQRDVRPYHVQTLSREIEAGRFRDKTQITFCKLGDAYHLTNGQHTLHAICASKMVVVLSVIVKEVGSDLEIADDFARHDTHLTRTMADSLVAHELHLHFGITRTQLSWVASACLYYAYMIGACPKSVSQVSHDEKLKITNTYGKLAVDAIGTVCRPDRHYGKYLIRRTTMAAMMVVYKYSPELCQEFFGEISKDDGLKQGDPRKALLDFFVRVGAGGGGSITRVKELKADHELVKSIAMAWNAFVNRRQLSLIRIRFDDKEVVFDKCGTFRV